MITYLPFILIALLAIVFLLILRVQAGAAKKNLTEIEKRLSSLEDRLSALDGTFRDEIRKSGEETDRKMAQLRDELRSALNSFMENTGKKLAENAAAQKSRFDQLSDTIASLRLQEQQQLRRPPVATPLEEATPAPTQPTGTPPVTPPSLEKTRAEKPASAEPPAHAKAKRLARLIVSDIALYNQAAVEEGIRNNTFTELLAHDIKEARTLYAQRVPDEIRNTTTYLDDAFEELIARKKRELNIG